ncbi:MAG: ABC transporter substrate-binding protein [Anaerolineae bacterium]|nr:ABC transporter substrate-binding protein [Anaerolineae bacterium]
MSQLKAILIASLVLLMALSACQPDEPLAVIETEMVVEQEADPTATEMIAEEPTLEPTESVTATPEIVEYFPDKAVIEYATGFSVEYIDNYKVVTVTKPWDFADETFTYILVQRGTEAPTGYGEAPIIEVPIQTIVPLSTTFLPYLDLYGQLDSIMAVSDATYITNPSVLDIITTDNLPAVGYGPGIDVETLLDLEPEVVMTSGYGFPDYDTHPVLIQAGLTTVINGDYMENTPLGRAEWGKFIALFYNQEKTAAEFFDQTVASYNEIKELAETAVDKPLVFMNTAFEGTWYVPGGQSFMSNFVTDAGGAYLWEDDPSTGSLYLSFEEVYDVAGENGEIWLNPGGYTFTADDLVASDERYATFAAYQTGMMFNNTNIMSATGGNDFFESGVAYPDKILADLFAIFHPEMMEMYDPDFEFTYYMKVKSSQ